MAPKVSPIRSGITYARDTLQNLISGLGTGKDKTVFNSYVLTMLDRGQLEAAYRSDWVARKIVDIPAKDSTRQWRNWLADEQQIEDIEAEEKRLNVQSKVKQAMIRGRLYGGGCLLLGLKNSNPAEPIDVEKIKQGDLEFVHVLSRHQLGAGQIERDPASEWFGQPKEYTLQTSSAVFSGQMVIHPSRLVRFLGAELPDSEIAGNDGWGDSILQAVDDAVKNVGLSSQGIAAMVNEAKIDVIKIPGLMNNISQADYRERLLERFTLANTAKSVFNKLLLDKEEEWERIEAKFTDLPDVLRLYLVIASGAADIPATRLLSQSPQGMNATGDSDTRNYYDRLSGEQETEVTPALTTFDEVLIRSALGTRPDELYYTWRPLWQMTEQEKSAVAKNKAETYKIDHDVGLIDSNVLHDARKNQLIEDGFYPGFEQSIDEFEDETRDLNENDPATELQLAMMKNQMGGVPGADPATDPNGDPVALPGGGGGGEQPKQLKKKKPLMLKGKPKKKGGPIQKSKTTDGRWVRYNVRDAQPKPLYVYREVKNTGDILNWAKAQGFASTLPASDLHVTILFSRSSVDWIEMGEPFDDKITVAAGGPRVVEQMPGSEAIVLQFASSALQWRHCSMCDRGASHDYETYIPHITLSYEKGTVDLNKVEPYRGKIELGPEIFSDI